MEQFFPYGEHEIAYLKSRDKRLGEIIDKVGMVKRRVIPDLFAALVHSIVGQQIATKAHETIWRKMTGVLGEISPEKVLGLSPEELQAFGITFRKVDCIRSAARKIASGEFDIHSLRTMSDAEVCAKLSELDGIGVWTAEMLMLHSLQRPDVLSFGDLAVQRGFADAVSSPQNHPPPVREIPPPLFSLRQCCLYLSMGGVGRCGGGFERLCTEREKRWTKKKK